MIGDGHLGIWGALTAVFPETAEQRCWNHRIVNILDKLPLKEQAAVRSLLTKIPYAETRDEAERQKRAFQGGPRSAATPRSGARSTATGNG